MIRTDARSGAACVAVHRGDVWRGLLALGPPGSGKSALCLGMIALGARLVADDVVIVTADPAADRLDAAAPPEAERIAGPGRGAIEARGVGLLSLPRLATAPIVLVADLAPPSNDADHLRRLPAAETTEILGLRRPIARAPGGAAAASVLFLLLSQGALLDPSASAADG